MKEETYGSVDEMWAHLMSDLLRAPVFTSRVGSCSELIGWQGTLENIDRTFVLNPTRNLSPVYAAAELLWYFSCEQSVSRIVPYAPSYYKYAEGDTVYGQYGHRWLNDPAWVAESGQSEMHQILAAIELLRQDPNTRQAVVTMWNGGDLAHAIEGDHKDLPCTLTYQFILRGNRLHLVCTMRSQDAWMGFPYDLWINTTIQRLVAASLGTEPGSYTHQCGSEHLYEKHFERAREAIAPRTMSEVRGEALRWTHQSQAMLPGWTGRITDLMAKAEYAVHTEAKFRTDEARFGKPITRRTLDRIRDNVGRSNPIHDAVLMVASKWQFVNANLLSSPLMRAALMASH